jgi:hypothetical protein
MERLEEGTTRLTDCGWNHYPERRPYAYSLREEAGRFGGCWFDDLEEESEDDDDGCTWYPYD